MNYVKRRNCEAVRENRFESAFAARKYGSVAIIALLP